MPRALLSLGCLLLIPVASPAEGLPQTLHVGLEGWKPTRHPDSWKVEGGELVLANDPGKQGSTLWSEHAYRDFVMELEFRFDGGVVDSGVFLRQENDQVQIGVSGSLKRDMTASPYIGGKGYPVEADGVADLLKPDGWNAMKIVVVGSDYDVWLNGRHVTHYESDTAVEEGPVGLQVHPGNEMRMRYRNIRLAELQ